MRKFSCSFVFLLFFSVLCCWVSVESGDIFLFFFDFSRCGLGFERQTQLRKRGNNKGVEESGYAFIVGEGEKGLMPWGQRKFGKANGVLINDTCLT